MQRILCLGDSNTYGYDPRSYLGSRYPASVRWTGRLEGAERKLVNLGQNGLCIYRETQFPVLRAWLESKGRADRILVMLGTNDLLQGTEPERCAEHMEALLRFLWENTGAALLLIAPPPMEPGAWVESEELIERSKTLAALYRQLAERLDIPFADAGGWGVELCFDGVHFSPAGHAAFAAGLERLL